MNLYNLHPNPRKAPGYSTRHDTVPELIWKRYKNQPAELKKRELALAKNAEHAFLYANLILNGPFPAGEAAIASDASYSFAYAHFVLRGPFPAGEAAIASDARCAFWYARDVLKLEMSRFKPL